MKPRYLDMAILTKMQQLDYQKFFVEKGDPGFNPTRNKAVIEKTIKRTNELYRLKQKQFTEEYAERADAVITYLKALDRGGAASSIKHFFGDSTLRMLNGDKKREEVRAKIREGIELVKKNAQMKRIIHT